MRFKLLSSNSLVACACLQGDFVYCVTHHSAVLRFLIFFTRRFTPYVFFQDDKWSVKDLFERGAFDENF